MVYTDLSKACRRNRQPTSIRIGRRRLPLSNDPSISLQPTIARALPAEPAVQPTSAIQVGDTSHVSRQLAVNTSNVSTPRSGTPLLRARPLAPQHAPPDGPPFDPGVRGQNGFAMQTEPHAVTPIVTEREGARDAAVARSNMPSSWAPTGPAPTPNPLLNRDMPTAQPHPTRQVAQAPLPRPPLTVTNSPGYVESHATLSRNPAVNQSEPPHPMPSAAMTASPLYRTAQAQTGPSNGPIQTGPDLIQRAGDEDEELLDAVDATMEKAEEQKEEGQRESGREVTLYANFNDAEAQVDKPLPVVARDKERDDGFFLYAERETFEVLERHSEAADKEAFLPPSEVEKEEEAEEEEIDIDRLSRDVYQKLKGRLAREWEQRRARM